MTKRNNYDVKPQFLNGVVGMSAANTYTSATMHLPINPAASVANGKARVIEILKIWIDAAPDTLAEDAAIGAQVTYAAETGLVAPTRPEAWILKYQWDMQLITSGAIALVTPQCFDLTDGNGNGVLVATDRLYLGAYSGGQAAAINMGFKILYRYVDIPIEEYVGLIGSQQGM